jgi:hypothetical protein
VLVDFASTRLYDRRVSVATRSPATTGVDCIEVVRVAGRRDADGVVSGEVDRVISLLHDARRFGASSVGVVTPFRAQSDALERAVLAAFTADDLEALDLRVGTVHAFQGNERDHVIVSLGIGPDQDRPWHFVEDRHLLAVLLTRARLRLTIVHSADPPADGLLAAYLAQADAPPGPPEPAGPVAPWTRRVADALADAGVDVIASYPVGRHLVDVCVASGSDWLGLDCALHPGGPAAHIERHLELRRAGWRLVDAYESRWGAPLGGTDRLGELVIDVLSELRSGRSLTS